MNYLEQILLLLSYHCPCIKKEYSTYAGHHGSKIQSQIKYAQQLSPKQSPIICILASTFLLYYLLRRKSLFFPFKKNIKKEKYIEDI
ncbi:hypothetical protein pb186bvf_013568 [Paramecium bursaria]